MSKLEMQQCVLGQVFTNCYFLKNKKTGELLIVDPGDYAEKVFQKVAIPIKICRNWKSLCRENRWESF